MGRTAKEGTAPSAAHFIRAQADNRSTATAWAIYRAHRSRVTNLILDLAGGDATNSPELRRSLCVLGAGNCNDLDLNLLMRYFRRVCLVDIDGDAVHAGVARQTTASRDIEIRAGVDLATCSVLDEFGGAHYGVVCSTTLLSQLIAEIPGVGGLPSPDTQARLRSTRAAHLKLMIDLTEPDLGHGLLVNDLVSSMTYPSLDGTVDLLALMERLVATGNFFTGNNPFAILDQLRSDRALRAADDVRLRTPWIWRMTDQMSRLVYALSFKTNRIEGGKTGAPLAGPPTAERPPITKTLSW